MVERMAMPPLRPPRGSMVPSVSTVRDHRPIVVRPVAETRLSTFIGKR